MTLKNKITKFISIFLIIAILAPAVLLSKPKQVTAEFPVADWVSRTLLGVGAASSATTAGSTVVHTGLKIKEVLLEVLRQIIMTIERRLLQEMTKGVVGWINSGFHGSPLFLENPESFFKDIGKYEIKTLIDLTGYDPNRFPFGPAMALNTIDAYKRKFADNAEYSLVKAIQDPVLLKRYRNDFNFGGWNGFLTNTQYPQNNYVGYQMMYTEELARKLEDKVTNKIGKVRDTLNQGMGFLSPQTCPSNPKYNNGKNEFQRPKYKPLPYKAPDPVYEKDEDGNIVYESDNPVETEASQQARKQYDAEWQIDDEIADANWSKTNVCPGGLQTTTPGSVVANQITTAMGSTFRQSELGAALGNSIGAILDALMNHFLEKGLNALAGAVNPTPPTDNWSYSGQTLEYNTPNTENLGVPKTIYTNVSKEISVEMSGGTAPYIIEKKPEASVATAKIIGNTLTISGVATGQTSLTIKDSSESAKSVATDIVINNTVGLVIDFNNRATQNISVGVSDLEVDDKLANINISGGVAPYTIKTNSDKSTKVAIARISNTSLIISGIAPGQISITIEDSSSPAKTATVQITVNNENNSILTATPQKVSIKAQDTKKVSLVDGTEPYTIKTDSEEKIALASLLGNTLTISGYGQGNTSVIVQDSSFPTQTVTVDITVGPAPGELGTCKTFMAIQIVPKDQCTSSASTWEPLPLPAPAP